MSRHHRIPGTARRSCTPTLLVLASIPDHLDERTKIAIRDACATEGRCPVCGVVGEITADREVPMLWRWTFRHGDDCPSLRDDEAAA